VRARDLAALEFDQVRDRLAQFAASPAGASACRELAPSADRAVVQQALDAAWQCVRLVEERGPIPVGEFPDLRPALRSAAHEGFVLDGASLVGVRTVLEVVRAVRTFLARYADGFPALADLAAYLTPLAELHATLRRSLDDRGDVLDDASDELAEVRRTIRRLRDTLTRRLDDLVGRPSMADQIADRYVTVRNNRFVIPVKTAVAAQFNGVVQDRSTSGETTFIEPLFAVELNNRLLLAAKEEEALVRRVLADLTDMVRRHLDELGATFAALVDVDVLHARVRFALAYRCTQPMLDDTEVVLRQARHPVLLFAGRAVTPIDVLLPPGKRILVISGPNTGGKTVALKTLGLVALMAQSGMLVPAAEGSRLPCFRAVYADIGDEQNIARNLSTFSAHVANLADILQRHQAPVLVLLDEPGVGTDPEDGAALGVGVLRLLEARDVRVVVSTHYAAIKVFALAHEACVTAAVDFDLDRLLPRYRLIYHSVGESLALPIAQRLGLPDAVLQAAERARSEQSSALAAAMGRLEEARRHYEERVAQAAEDERRTARAREETERLLSELREKRRRRWADELETARDFVRDVRDRGRELLAAVERGAADRRAVRRFVEEQERHIATQAAALAEPPQQTAPPVVGDHVEVSDRGIRGELVAVAGQRAWIQRGSLRFEVPATSLRRLTGEPPARVEVRVSAAAEDVPHEISLLGLRAKEAVVQLDEFMDRAARARYASVRIIHGIGSGALKRAVADYLAGSPYCTGFRPGEGGEGGTGVTVAELAAD
jgi:DNA mismatch repair protein MutS2